MVTGPPYTDGQLQAVLFIAIITGLLFAMLLISFILAILDFALWFGAGLAQNHWTPLLLLAYLMWMLRSNSKATSSTPAKKKTAKKKTAKKKTAKKKTAKKKTAKKKTAKKKEDPGPPSLLVAKGKLPSASSVLKKGG